MRQKRFKIGTRETTKKLTRILTPSIYSELDIVEAMESLISFSVIPIDQDKGSKRFKAPLTQIKDYFEDRPSDARRGKWLEMLPDCGLGLICGRVSEGLEVMDFESEEAFDAWLSKLSEPESSLVQDMPLVRTSSNGRHLYFRTADPSKSQVLATCRPDLTTKNGGLIIETRGERSYVACPPTRGYAFLRGCPWSTPEISIADRERLYMKARSLCGKVEPSKTFRPAQMQLRKRGQSLNRWLKFECVPWESILEEAGFVYCNSSGGHHYWTRPGKCAGVSATSTYGRDYNRFYCFSTSVEEITPFRLYSKLDFIADWWYGGDVDEAWNNQLLINPDLDFETPELRSLWRFGPE